MSLDRPRRVQLMVAAAVVVLAALAVALLAVDDPEPVGADPAAAGADPARDGAGARAPAAGTFPLSRLDGATVPATFELEVDVPADAQEASLVIDGRYVGQDVEPPLTFQVSLAPGEHRIKVRVQTPDGDERVDVDVTTAGEAGGSTSASTGSEAPAPTPTPADGSPSVGAGGELLVDSVEEIAAAVGTARPGAVIRVADGEYLFDDRLTASASGSADAPITLTGTRRAVLRTEDVDDDYGLHVTGDHWRIVGLTVAHASKGIVLDGSLGTVIENVEVHTIGDEAIHFRSCSSDGVLRDSFIHDTGLSSPQYGEGVYVGSANSNWSDYACTDPIEGVTEGDNTERVVIENNVFEDITAEGADLKEGTDSGVLRGNTFRRVGLSGENSADSAVDAKGNGWSILDNVVSETDATWLDEGRPQPSEFTDGFQTHAVYAGYGTANTFRGNRVEGAIPGYGVGLYPALDNVVACDNAAPAAARGLVGDNGSEGSCR